MKMPVQIYGRETYIKRIEPFIGKSIVKILTGHRRVGKSYILYQIIAKIRKEDKNANIIYINKEDIAFDEIRDYKQLND